MVDLFDKGPLQQEDGLLKERWGQEGSTIVTTSNSPVGDTTFHTVTSGKKLYMKSIQVIDNGTAGVFHIKDGGSSGTVKLIYTTGGSYFVNPINLGTPLEFETDVYFDVVSGSPDVDITTTGWEE